MKALVYTAPEQLELRDVADPEPNLDDEQSVVVRVEAVGICGSDMHAFLGHDERRPAPLILGHEAAGTIVTGPSAGMRVTVNPLVACGICSDCSAGRNNLCSRRQIISLPPREGAFGEAVAIPMRNVVEIPDDFPAEKASLSEPLACGWHAVNCAQRVLHWPLEDISCVVLGGGAIGLGAALVLQARGAREIWIAETNPARHPVLKAAGPFRIYNPAETPGPAAGAHPEAGRTHLVVDAFGGAVTRRAASALARPGGVIVHVGLADNSGGLDTRRMTLQEITFIGTYTYTAADFRDTATAILDGRLGALDWTEQRPLSAGPGAFADIRTGRAAAPKIVLTP